MKRELMLDDYKAAMDNFAVSFPSDYPVVVERHDIGSVAIYVFIHEGREVGRIEILPSTTWQNEPARFQLKAMARKPGETSELDRIYLDVLKRWQDHLDWHFGRGQWEVVSDRTPNHSDSGHFAYGPNQRRDIVAHYRRERGAIVNKGAWAQQHYGISGKTLRNYEIEYPEET